MHPARPSRNQIINHKWTGNKHKIFGKRVSGKSSQKTMNSSFSGANGHGLRPGQPLPDEVQVVFVGFEGTAKPFHFYAADHVGHLAFVQNCPALLLQEIEQLIEMDYTRTQIGLEFGSTGENNDAVEGRFGVLEE
jgi:hypothetical protein